MLISRVKPWAIPDQALLHDELAPSTFQLKHVTCGKSCWMVFNNTDGNCLLLVSVYYSAVHKCKQAPECRCVCVCTVTLHLSMCAWMILYKNLNVMVSAPPNSGLGRCIGLLMPISVWKLSQNKKLQHDIKSYVKWIATHCHAHSCLLPWNLMWLWTQPGWLQMLPSISAKAMWTYSLQHAHWNVI